MIFVARNGHWTVIKISFKQCFTVVILVFLDFAKKDQVQNVFDDRAFKIYQQSFKWNSFSQHIKDLRRIKCNKNILRIKMQCIV